MIFYFSAHISDIYTRTQHTIEEIFDGVYVHLTTKMVAGNELIDYPFLSIRGRLKEVLTQYELRERHFECVIRSKELEVLLSRARAAEQKQLAEGEKSRSLKQEEEVCIHP